MKVIGVEIRFGAFHSASGERKYEAQLVPFSLEYPPLLSTCSDGRGVRPFCEVTVHTSKGDVTMRADLPLDFNYKPGPVINPSYEDVHAAFDELERQVVAAK